MKRQSVRHGLEFFKIVEKLAPLSDFVRAESGAFGGVGWRCLDPFLGRLGRLGLFLGRLGRLVVVVLLLLLLFLLQPVGHPGLDVEDVVEVAARGEGEEVGVDWRGEGGGVLKLKYEYKQNFYSKVVHT